MSNLVKYCIVAVLAFLIGSAAVVSAQGIEKLVISNEAGTNSARVNKSGRLHVQAKGSVNVSNLPATQRTRRCRRARSLGSRTSGTPSLPSSAPDPWTTSRWSTCG